MPSNSISWLPVVILGGANVIIGRLIATWGKPRGKVAKNSYFVLVLAISLMGIGSTILYYLNGLQLTFVQAGILSGCFLGSYIFHSGNILNLNPPVSWDEYLNKRVHTVMKVCEHHGWDISTMDSIQALITSGQIHFNGSDYDTLAGVQGDLEYNIDRERIQSTPDGEIDYDYACKSSIVILTYALAGFDDHEGIVSRVSQDYDMSGFDWVAFERLKQLCEAIRLELSIDK